MKKIAFITTLFSMSVSEIHCMDLEIDNPTNEREFIREEIRISIPLQNLTDEEILVEDSQDPYPFVINCPAPNQKKKIPLRKKKNTTPLEKRNRMFIFEGEIEHLKEEFSKFHQVPQKTEEANSLPEKEIQIQDTEIKNLIKTEYPSKKQKKQTLYSKKKYKDETQRLKTSRTNIIAKNKYYRILKEQNEAKNPQKTTKINFASKTNRLK